MMRGSLYFTSVNHLLNSFPWGREIQPIYFFFYEENNSGCKQTETKACKGIQRIMDANIDSGITNQKSYKKKNR
jgi:hypothetical protein